MSVLKGLMSRNSSSRDDDDEASTPRSSGSEITDAQHQLQCIVTAFELLSGQGEALDIDLTDFINRLYALIPILSLMPDIESERASRPSTSTSTPSTSTSSNAQIRANGSGKPQASSKPHTSKPTSTSDMLFRALFLAFSLRHPASASTGSQNHIPSWRSAAFTKRLLTASLHWPPSMILRTLDFVGTLLDRDSKLLGLFTSDAHAVGAGGKYRPDLQDPQLCNPFGSGCELWELSVLEKEHLDTGVREKTKWLVEVARAAERTGS